jgi:hypothetical protein
MRLGRNARRRLVFYPGLVASLAALLTWMIAMPGSSFHGPLPPPDALETRLAESLHADVSEIAGSIGERNLPKPAALDRARDYITSELTRAGYIVRRQDYSVYGIVSTNLDTESPGDGRKGEIVVVGAHYDSVAGALGADDNGSGVAAVLALARAFAGRHTARTLRFVAFANEEPPYFWTDDMGSLVYAKACRARGDNIVAMLSLETVAYFRDAPHTQHYPPPLGYVYPDRGDFVAFVGNLGSRTLTRDAVRVFRQSVQLPSEGAALPGWVPGVGWSDQWAFWQVGYPGVMVTDTAPFRNPNYHTSRDAPDTLDYPRFARVVSGLSKVVEAIATPVQ